MSFLRVSVGDAVMVRHGVDLRVIWVKEITPDDALFNEMAVDTTGVFTVRARDFQRKDEHGVWRACLHPRGRDMAGACFDCGNFSADHARQEETCVVKKT